VTAAIEGSTAGNRKRLGQVFTGERLARVLAALARAGDVRSIIDPMSGLGHMLAGSSQVGARSASFAAIEIDPAIARACKQRLGERGLSLRLVTGNAFDPAAWQGFPDSWDLVITNPPYVRYQLGSAARPGTVAIPSADQVRQGLIDCLAQAANLAQLERDVFLACAKDYSGLADLAVPSWLLCCSRVSLNGRLAIVVPNTWLSRDYATPVLYVLRRFFEIEFVVEDRDRTWFPDALVRTALVVARRVEDKGSPFVPGGHMRLSLPADLADDTSVIGRAFPQSATPEHEFAAWARRCLAERTDAVLLGARATWSDQHDLVAAIRRGIKRHPGLPHDHVSPASHEAVPEQLRELLPSDGRGLKSLGDLGWTVGQGLRTGANEFFYVTEDRLNGGFRSSLLPGEVLDLPHDVLRPALRRQAELPQDSRQVATTPASHVLVLNEWALPEDIEATEGSKPWRSMDGDLEKLVRTGAGSTVERANGTVRLPELSAVRTNVRRSAPGELRSAAFWYHLPPLAPRHMPAILLARVNGGTPAAYMNPGNALVIDANFSTLWPSAPGAVDPKTMLALLSSSWVAAFLELIGTVMGGGALKVEATHLRRLLVPAPEEAARTKLSHLANPLLVGGDRKFPHAAIDEIALGIIGARPAAAAIKNLASQLLLIRSRRSPSGMDGRMQ
jgi:tRNA G10  N-methylase Trm11